MKKRILLIIPNLGRGGAQQVFRQQLKYLSSEFDVFGCVFNWEGSFLNDRLENVFSLNVPAGKSVVGKVLFFFLRVIRLRSIKKHLKIDVSISHLEGADYINLLTGCGERTICWIHGTKKFDKNISGFLGFVRMRILMPFLYKRAGRIVTVSGGIAFELAQSVKGLKSLITVIYNGFDLKHILALAKEPLENEVSIIFRDVDVIITHCRLSRQKNLNALLKIFSELKKNINVKLVIVGDGELRDELIVFAKNNKIGVWSCWENKPLEDFYEAYFIGQNSNPFNLLIHAKVYVMTSAWEGFPLALCEAMACGLPVVASDCYTGPREIMAPELNEPEPILKPYRTSKGILMPLADAGSDEIIELWARELKTVLCGESNFIKGSGFERIKDFELSLSLARTIKLIHEE